MKWLRQIIVAIVAVAACHAGCSRSESPNLELPTNIGGTIGLGGFSYGGSSSSVRAGNLGASGTKSGSGGIIKSGSAGKGGTSKTAKEAAGAGAKGGVGGSATAAGVGGNSSSTDWNAGCPTATPSDCEVVSATIVIPAGATRDYNCKCFIANASTLGNGDQGENQSPVFQLESGAALRNVVIGYPAADGVHCRGNATLENVVWTDIGEDALTVKESGTVIINGGYAANGSDKVFQINAASTFKVSNFKAYKSGKFIRQNGNTTFKINVEIDGCDISYMDESIFRTDSSSSTVKMTHTRYSHIGKQNFIVPSSSQVTESDNTAY